MKITIQQYGSSIIALSVFALLLGMCMSLLEKNGKYANALGGFAEHTIKENLLAETNPNSAFNTYRNQALPKIFSYGRYEIKTGSYTAISACFYGIDKDGMEIPVKVNNIWDENGKQMTTVFWNGTECFYFEKGGIYRLVLEAEDKNGKVQTAYVKIFVNEAVI